MKSTPSENTSARAQNAPLATSGATKPGVPPPRDACTARGDGGASPT